MGVLNGLTINNSGTLELRQGARIKLSGGSGNNYIEGNVANSGRIGIFTDNIERMKIWLSGQTDFTNNVAITGTLEVGTVGTLTAGDATVIDSTYGTVEEAVINNLRTRVDELEDRLQTIGLIN